MIADAAQQRRPARRAHRDVLDRLLDGHRAHRRAVRRPERAVPRRAGARARRLGVRLGAGACSRATTLPVEHARARRARRRRSTATARSTRSRYGGEHEHYAAGDARRHRRRRRRPLQLLRLLRPALRRRVLGRRARHRLLRRRRQLARHRGATTGARCCRPGRSRTRPTSSASTASAAAAGSTTRATARSCSRSAKRRRPTAPTEQTLVRDVDPDGRGRRRAPATRSWPTDAERSPWCGGPVADRRERLIAHWRSLSESGRAMNQGSGADVRGEGDRVADGVVEGPCACRGDRSTRC